MPSQHEAGTDVQRARRTLRVAIIAGAIGSVAGAVTVMAAVATVLSITNPTNDRHGTAAPNKPPAAQSAIAAMPVAKNHCKDHTWPNIPSQCLTRVDAKDQPTALKPSSLVAAVKTATAAPPALRPGSLTVPAPPRSLEGPASEATPPVVETPPQKAMTSKPTRKAERPLQAPKIAARQAGDDDDDTTPAVATARRVSPRNEPRLEPAAEQPARRYTVMRRIESDDDFLARPMRPASPVGFLGALFGPANDDD